MERLGQLEKQYREAERRRPGKCREGGWGACGAGKADGTGGERTKILARLQETREKLGRGWKEKAEVTKQEEGAAEAYSGACGGNCAEYQLVNSPGKKQVAALSLAAAAEQEATVRDEAGLSGPAGNFMKTGNGCLRFYDIIQAQ